MSKLIVFGMLFSMLLLWSCKASKVVTVEQIAGAIPPEFNKNNNVLLIEDFGGGNAIRRFIYKRMLRAGNYQGKYEFVLREKKLEEFSKETSRYLLFEEFSNRNGQWINNQSTGGKSQYQPGHGGSHGYSILDRITGKVYHNHENYGKANLKVYFGALEAARTKE